MTAAGKTERRQLRYLRLLAKGSALLGDTASADMRLLEFPGVRAVRCAAADIDAMRRAGRITVVDGGDARTVAITDEGRATLSRLESGDPAERHRSLRAGRIEIDGRAEPVVVNDAESPLSGLARMKRPDGQAWLDRAEIAAGETLRSDFELAMLQPRVTASWDAARIAKSPGSGRNGVADLSDRAMAARDRVAAAIDAVGPDLSGAMVDICCFLKGLEQVERERAWPRRSAKLMLKTALAMLDRHYHPQSERPRHARKVLHWGAQDYRPTLR